MTNAIRNSKVDSEMESTAERGSFFFQMTGSCRASLRKDYFSRGMHEVNKGTMVTFNRRVNNCRKENFRSTNLGKSWHT